MSCGRNREPNDDQFKSTFPSLPDPGDYPDGMTKRGAHKADSEKVDLSLVPMEAINAIAQAFEHGLTKYERGNYKLRPHMESQRLVASILGHIGNFSAHNEIDDESGLPHLYHAGAALCMLLHNTVQEPIRERYKKGEVK